ncbi:RNA exonuclease 4-like isoform X1 [Rhinatrema bivittatum]|uniref:RNA exonuclease 4-like isoform X1 n=2 Tax=Rhinatrema bivittatum TaxID=194408 RepID=UPI00112790CB|nr:RNA exonuclease 4-like isoform X1 [Rhinatrema bivittatum]
MTKVKRQQAKGNRKKKSRKMGFQKATNKNVERKAGSYSQAAGMLPPKTPQEFSTNWKNLQELLQQKAASLESPSLTLPASAHATQTCYETKNKVKDSKSQETAIKKKNRNVQKTIPEGEAPKKARNIGVTLAMPATKTNVACRALSSVKEDKTEKRRGGRTGTIVDDIKQKRRECEEKEEQPSAEIDIWFDDVDPDDIEAAIGPEAAKIAREKLGIAEGTAQDTVEKALVKDKAFSGLTRAVAMDCEMVGVGPDGEESIVARVSIVNQFGKCIYDKYVKPSERVTDYRTMVSGIRPKDIRNGEQFKIVQKDVTEILKGRILVGHAVHNDLKILFLDHPKKKIRDTQKYKPFKRIVKSGRPSLKLLCERILNVKVQTSEHSSVQDAQAAMRLYTLEKKHWEAEIQARQKLPGEHKLNHLSK